MSRVRTLLVGIPLNANPYDLDRSTYEQKTRLHDYTLCIGHAALASILDYFDVLVQGAL